MTEPVVYTTVFDVAAAGYREWIWTVFGLAFVAVTVVIALRDWRRHPERTRLRRALVWLLPVLTALWTVAITAKTYSDYARLSGALESGAVVWVEGTVQNFVPMPAIGHAVEQFEVAGQKFEYSDFIVTGGFNHTANRGGPIRAGLPVRIAHVGGVIVRLQVAR
jgi:hypothetical protein